jgi:hypothetical protein
VVEPLVGKAEEICPIDAHYGDQKIAEFNLPFGGYKAERE